MRKLAEILLRVTGALLVGVGLLLIGLWNLVRPEPKEKDPPGDQEENRGGL